MKTYKQVFAELKQAGRPGLIPFFVIGDPDFDTSLDVVKTAIDAGADVLELGIAFSDPIADGPTIQKQRPSNSSGRSRPTRISQSAF